MTILNLAANELSNLPKDLSCFAQLEELNLASNSFGVESQSAVLDSLATLPKLKKLNLSRNRFTVWESEAEFPNLIELYLAFNGFL